MPVFSLRGVPKRQIPRATLCTGEQATGFGMNPKTHAWTAQHFRPRKYVFRAPIKGPNAPNRALTAVVAVYEVGKVDAANATAFCDKDHNEAGFLFCSGLGEDLNFNRQTLRFVHWFSYGYIDPPGSSFWGKEGEATARQLFSGICRISCNRVQAISSRTI